MTENLPQTFQERLKELAALQNARVEPSSGTITATADGFNIPDIGIAPSPMQVIVLDWVATNAFYDRPYKQGEIHPPACFALAANLIHESTIFVPIANAPVPQAVNCGVCPNNEYDSDPRGGKLCKNGYRVAILPLDAPKTAEQEPVPIMLVNISPKGIPQFKAYVRAFKRPGANIPYCAAITELSSVSAGTGFTTHIKRVGQLQEETAVLYFINRLPEAAKLLNRLPDFSTYEPPKKK